MNDYHINIFCRQDNGGYIADIPDLKYCSAFGNTPEDAVREVQVSKATWIEAAQAARKAIAQPKHRPATHQATPNAEGLRLAQPENTRCKGHRSPRQEL